MSVCCHVPKSAGRFASATEFLGNSPVATLLQAKFDKSFPPLSVGGQTWEVPQTLRLFAAKFGKPFASVGFLQGQVCENLFRPQVYLSPNSVNLFHPQAFLRPNSGNVFHPEILLGPNLENLFHPSGFLSPNSENLFRPQIFLNPNSENLSDPQAFLPPNLENFFTNKFFATKFGKSLPPLGFFWKANLGSPAHL